MRTYSNAIKAGILGLSMIAAMPAFTQSAHAGSAPSVDITALQKDPVHEAALKASANKIVFVLGEGFDALSMDLLIEDLAAIGLSKDKHYQILISPSMLRETGVFYINGQIAKLKSNDAPLVFTQDETESPVFAIKNLIKSGQITVARLEPNF